jgi:predicted flap endonuclease-1-like 5' DNA nuclease
MPPTSPEWMTTANLIIIALAMVLVVVAILYGARQSSRRNAAIEERNEHEDALIERTEAAHEVADAPVETPPVAPAPPPLTEVAPVVAAVPPVAATPVVTNANELGQLKGVGPKLAARLAELGYTSFDQIAALTPVEADALDAQLGTFKGRLTRDRWIEQADYLAKNDRAGFEAAFGKL